MRPGICGRLARAVIRRERFPESAAAREARRARTLARLPWSTFARCLSWPQHARSCAASPARGRHVAGGLPRARWPWSLVAVCPVGRMNCGLWPGLVRECRMAGNGTRGASLRARDGAEMRDLRLRDARTEMLVPLSE